MIVHRAIIHSPGKLRELAHDAYFWRRFRRFRHLERLADLSALYGVQVGLCVAEDASLNGSAGSEAAGVGTPATPAAAPGRVAAPRTRPDPAEPTPADWRLGPSFPEQRRRERP
jgi:hypothetical protein